MDISDMRDRMIDIEQNFKRSAREKETTNDRLNDVEKGVNQILGRDETGEATGTPSIVSPFERPGFDSRCFYFCELLATGITMIMDSGNRSNI